MLTVADKWKPICRGSFTHFVLNSCSPRWNSSAELLARHEYSRMSSSLSGKLQKAMRSWSCSGTGGKTCSTSSNGMNEATQRAASSVSEIGSSVGFFGTLLPNDVLLLGFGFFQPRQLLHRDSCSELHEQSEPSENLSESSKLNRSFSCSLFQTAPSWLIWFGGWSLFITTKRKIWRKSEKKYFR